ncbi:MAG TPA: ABC transporter permease [Thermoplasmata archaeon]|nr:ABC transporter permease [Thermoplasmata archaeon]
MSELSGLYALWEREFRVYLRERSRIVSTVISPLLWLFVFGGGFGAQFSVGNVDYQAFLYPGIIAMTMIFSSIFYGANVVWDKRLDFLKEVLVAPINRSTAFFGKVLGGATDCLIQATIIVILAPLLGVSFGFGFALAYLVIFVMLVGLVSVGLIIGAWMESPEGFSLLSGFVTFPLFFFSGALFPPGNLPSWLSVITFANPLTYGVDALRGATLGIWNFNVLIDFAVLVAFAAVTMVLGTLSFRRMRL